MRRRAVALGENCLYISGREANEQMVRRKSSHTRREDTIDYPIIVLILVGSSPFFFGGILLALLFGEDGFHSRRKNQLQRLEKEAIE
jgi:hypothetical protein